MNRGFVYSFIILAVSLFIINPVLPAGAQSQNSLGYNPNQILQQYLKAAQNDTASSVLGQISNFLKNFQGSNPNILQQIGNMLGQNSASGFLNTSANPFGNFSLSDAFNNVFNSPQVQQAVSVGETALDLYVQNYLESHGVSSVCYRDLKRTADGIVNNKDWAIRMIDAFGKPGSDLKNYQLKWIGAYEECLAVEPRDYQPTPDGYKATAKFFSGKYCKATIKLEKGDLPIQPSVDIGTCWPDTCSSSDIHGLLTSVVALVTQNEKAVGPDVVCQEKKSLDTKAIVALCILSVLGIMMVLGTLYDVLAIQMNKSSNNSNVQTQRPTFSKTNGITNGGFTVESEIAKVAMGEEANAAAVELEMRAIQSVDPSAPTLQEMKQTDVRPEASNTAAAPQGIAEKILLSFSVYTNGVKILSTHQSAGSLGAVNGIRFLSMAWVILGHSYFFAFGYTENLYRYFMEQQYVWHVMGILYASVSVDSFFALSGLLVAYLTLKELKKVGGIQNFNWFMFFFHRFWRLTPPYMLVLMCYTALAKYMGSGPMWPQKEMPFDGCDKSWWTNLLYINNFVDKEDKEACIGWTWYLANDMQFYILSPLLLIPLFYQMIIGGIVSLLFLVATVVTTALIVMNHHYPAQGVSGVPPADDGKYNDNVYIPCYTRMGPYIIGLVTGYILYRTKCKVHMPKIVVLLGWLVCVGICLSVVYGPYTDKDLSHIFTMEQSIAYHSLSRTGWGVAICWIVFACATGHGGWINEVLSWKAFIPLGRLTYCAYLIHPIIELFYYMSRRRLLYFNIYEVIYMFLPNLVLSYGIAFLVSLAFESPMMGLERAIFKRDRRS